MSLSKLALGTLALVSLITVGSQAFAGTAVAPTAGRPFNTSSTAGFSFGDNQVSIAPGYTWMIPVPVATSSAVVNRSLLFYRSGSTSCGFEAWSFNADGGTAYSGVGFSSAQVGTATLAVPPNGNVMVKAYNNYNALGNATLYNIVIN
jgi:hypothetical protein